MSLNDHAGVGGAQPDAAEPASGIRVEFLEKGRQALGGNRRAPIVDSHHESAVLVGEIHCNRFLRGIFQVGDMLDGVENEIEKHPGHEIAVKLQFRGGDPLPGEGDGDPVPVPHHPQFPDCGAQE